MHTPPMWPPKRIQLMHIDITITIMFMYTQCKCTYHTELLSTVKGSGPVIKAQINIAQTVSITQSKPIQ